MMQSNIWGVGARTFSTTPFSRYSTEIGEFSISRRDPNSSGYISSVISPGRKAVIDYLSGKGGPSVWPRGGKPIKDYLVPFGYPWSAPPANDGLEWKLGVELKILFDDDIGMTELFSNSAYFVNRMWELYNRWCHTAEACLGQLAVYEIKTPEPIWNAAQVKNFFPPQLVQVGWFDRDDAVWGPVTVPLPMAALTSANDPAGPMPPALGTPANDVSTASASVMPAAAPVASATSVTPAAAPVAPTVSAAPATPIVPTVPAAAAPAAPAAAPMTEVPAAPVTPAPANDPLARYRPLAPGTKSAF